MLVFLDLGRSLFLLEEQLLYVKKDLECLLMSRIALGTKVGTINDSYYKYDLKTRCLDTRIFTHNKLR